MIKYVISLLLGFPIFWKRTVPICHKFGFCYRHYKVACSLKESLHSPWRCADLLIWLYPTHAELWFRVRLWSIYHYLFIVCVLKFVKAILVIDFVGFWCPFYSSCYFPTYNRLTLSFWLAGMYQKTQLILYLTRGNTIYRCVYQFQHYYPLVVLYMPRLTCAVDNHGNPTIC